MKMQPVDLVLPRLAKTLFGELQRFQTGELNEEEFSSYFENLLQRHHDWLTTRGISDQRATLAIHGAVLVLSSPGLRTEAATTGVPFEVLEYRAIKEAAADIARNHGIPERRAVHMLGQIVSSYAQ